MIQSQQITPGMILKIRSKFYRVESCVKVTTAKGNPFVKTKLCHMETQKISEKNFKLGQLVEEASLDEKDLEYLYPEDKNHVFLDTQGLETTLVPQNVVGEKTRYLKEGVEVKAAFFGDAIFSVELPQFLEFMVIEAEESPEALISNEPKSVVLETGAKIMAPPFIEVGDIIKIDTTTHEYVQRV